MPAMQLVWHLLSYRWCGTWPVRLCLRPRSHNRFQKFSQLQQQRQGTWLSQDKATPRPVGHHGSPKNHVGCMLKAFSDQNGGSPRFETHPSMQNEQLGVLMKSILLDSFSPAGAWFTCVEASTCSIRSSILLLGCEMDNKFMFHHRHHVSVRRQCEITK